jgi:hypothetical protein
LLPPTNSPAPSPPAGTVPNDGSNVPPPNVPAAPVEYTFKAPEGANLDDKLIASATPIFRELGLDNAAAQKLVDLYNTQALTQAQATARVINTMGETWRTETMADPILGPNMPKIQAEVGKAYDVLVASGTLKQAEVDAFRSTMDQTMIGNNPAFVRVLWRMAQALGEGSHVPGGNPSPHGQDSGGNANSRPSIAHAMYPNLSKAS